MRYNLSTKLILIGILLIALGLRLYGLNWDQGNHLHPDERFLTMVSNAMKIPGSFASYLNPSVSTFNPANVGFSFFVYGAFPLILSKLLAVLFNFDNYGYFTLFGRAVSALLDTLVVLIIYKIVQLFEKNYDFNKSIKFLSSGVYAISVLPIQLSHFFAVDTFLNLFVFLSIYKLTKYSFDKKIIYLIFGAIFFGLAMASKVSAIFIVPLLLFLIMKPWFRQLKKLPLQIILFGIICFFTLRLSNPYVFQNINLLDPRPSALYVKNLKELQRLSNPDAWFPPNVQWRYTTPVIFPLENIAFFGLGFPLFIFVVIGMLLIIKNYRRTLLFYCLIWCLLFFIYQSTRITKTMRYFIILYPFFAIFAAIGIDGLLRFIKGKTGNKIILNTYYIILATILLVWPLSFMSIYTKDHSRVEASKFIYKNFPDNSTILTEHWDDSVPLRMPTDKSFKTKELPVFGEDTTQKWIEMDDLLDQGDYLILSSNRGWGSIPTSPDRYPVMTEFYKNLLADKTSYKKIATFTSYPSLKYLGLPIVFSDDTAEEAFTVYDHPKVIIFQKLKK